MAGLTYIEEFVETLSSFLNENLPASVIIILPWKTIHLSTNVKIKIIQIIVWLLKQTIFLVKVDFDYN